jgi:hypothetical protein
VVTELLNPHWRKMAHQFQISTKRVAIGTAIALLTNIVIYLIGSSASATWQVGLPTTVSLPLVAIATAVPMLLGGLTVGLISKRWPGVIGLSSWAVLIFSIAGAPSGYISSQDAATGVALGAMHLVVGFAWFVSIRNKK